VKLGIFELLLVFLGPLLAGAGLLRSIGIGWRSDRLGYCGWAWLTGNLLAALVTFVYFAIPLPTRSWPHVELMLLAVALVLFWVGRKRDPAAAVVGPAGARAETIAFRWFVGFVIILVVLRILAATLWPVLVDDEANFWALKSKILFESGGFNAAFEQRMNSPIAAVYQADYPLLDPLLQARVFLLAGQITHVANRLPLQGFALAEALIVMSALRRVARPWIAACLSLLLLACSLERMQAGNGGGDLIVGLGALATFDAWLMWRASGSNAWGRLAAVSLAFMLWSKNEAFLYALSIVVAVVAVDLLRTRKVEWKRMANPWLLAPLAIVILHVGFNRSFGFESTFSKHVEGNLLALFFEQFTQTLPDVVRYFGRYLFADPDFSNWTLTAFFVLLVCFPRRVTADPRLAIPGFALVLGILGLMAAFVASPAAATNQLGWHLHTAATRVVFQLVPCAVLWLGVAVPALDLRAFSAPSPASSSPEGRAS